MIMAYKVFMQQWSW